MSEAGIAMLMLVAFLAGAAVGKYVGVYETIERNKP